MNLYKKFDKNITKINADGGYKPLIGFAPVDTYAIIGMPVVGGTPALGDTKKIAADDTFTTGNGIIMLDCKIHSVTSKSTTVGEDGAFSLEHTFEGEILGDSEAHLEQFEDMLNDKNLFYVKDQDCLAGGYMRFGDECSQPSVKVEFDGKTTKDGKKSYKLTGTIKGKKFFYGGAITEKP